MKLFREALIILGIYLAGEIISDMFSLPIPGNILGMIILFILLCTKTVKLNQISNVTNFLLNHLAFFFIPAGVGLMSSAGIIKATWLQLIIVCIISTVVIIGVTGITVQFVAKRKESNAYDKVNDLLNDKNISGEI